MWLPIHDGEYGEYIEASEYVEAQEAAEYSFLKNFRQFVTLERKKVLRSMKQASIMSRLPLNVTFIFSA